MDPRGGPPRGGRVTTPERGNFTRIPPIRHPAQDASEARSEEPHRITALPAPAPAQEGSSTHPALIPTRP